MADLTLNVDGNIPASVTAASKWLQGVSAWTDAVLGRDGYTPAVVTAGSKWIEAAVDSSDKTLRVDGYVPAIAAYRNAVLDPTEQPCNFWTVRAANWETTWYKMRGMDALTDGLYATWLSSAAPDTTGALYSGPLNRPLRDVIVIDTWSSS